MSHQPNELQQMIAAAIHQKQQQGVSIRELAVKLDVAAGTIHNVKDGEWEKISDKMLRKLAAGLDVHTEDWMPAKTQAFNMLNHLLWDAKYHQNVYGVICQAGGGKSYTSRLFARSSAEVYRVECADFMNKKIFLSELLVSMGRNPSGCSVYEMLKEIEAEILKKVLPIIILDEVDKLRDEVLYFFITLYNKLEGHCGIVLLSTNHIQRRIAYGLSKNKKGYQEIFSRLNRKFVTLPNLGGEDIRKVCEANGVTEDQDIKRIIGDSDTDLRRVKTLVHVKKVLAKPKREEDAA